jgi:hypothetical protein
MQRVFVLGRTGSRSRGMRLFVYLSVYGVYAPGRVRHVCLTRVGVWWGFPCISAGTDEVRYQRR